MMSRQRPSSCTPSTNCHADHPALSNPPARVAEGRETRKSVLAIAAKTSRCQSNAGSSASAGRSTRSPTRQALPRPPSSGDGGPVTPKDWITSEGGARTEATYPGDRLCLRAGMSFEDRLDLARPDELRLVRRSVPTDPSVVERFRPHYRLRRQHEASSHVRWHQEREHRRRAGRPPGGAEQPGPRTCPSDRPVP